MDTPLPVTLADVEAAAARIAGAVPPTPSARSETLSDITGADVVVKFENLEFTASFKERGALNRLLLLSDDEARRGVIAMSAGNHAQALAHHGRRLGIPVTLVMPSWTASGKVARTEDMGARVVLHGEDLDAAERHAHELAASEGLVYVPPFDDAAVIAGQGTVALELLGAHPDLEVLVVPTGGGGLLAGVAVAAKARNPEIEVIGAQTELFPTLVRHAVHPGGSGSATIADGIAVPTPGVLTRTIVDALVDDVVSVQEASIERAVSLYLEIEKVVSEGAGAVGLAALLEDPARFAGRRVGLILSGGNIDLRLLAQVVMRTLARSGRLTRLRVLLDDRPGTLARVATAVGEVGANIISVSHDRYRPELALKTADLELTVETRDRAHYDALVARLEADGLRVATEPVAP